MPIDDSGVERLLAIWGGEVASWTLEDNGAELGLPAIGLPRIMEIAMPIATAMDGSVASTIAGRLVDLRMADLGFTKYRGGIDLYNTLRRCPLSIPKASRHMRTWAEAILCPSHTGSRTKTTRNDHHDAVRAIASLLC
ncbi:hypothetical protein ELI43_26445 (plasmid) [Rhizobium leguminosarum]|nr:hypothetical protein ELI43_26445 [Rhizobium leguminosarum]